MAHRGLLRLAVPATALAACLLCAGVAIAAGGNLVKNGGGEQVGTAGVIPKWKLVFGSGPELIAYGADGGFPATDSPGPTNRGANFFSGGPNDAQATLSQKIDLSAYASTIATGTAKFKLQGWLGGFSVQDDSVTVDVQWLAGKKEVGAGASIGPVVAADRESITGLVLRKVSGTVPSTATAAVVHMTFTRASGTYNDGYADTVSLTIS